LPANPKTELDQATGGGEYIPQKRENILFKQKRYSAEAARLTTRGLERIRDTNPGGFLAIVERALKDGGALDVITKKRLEEYRMAS
jgi:hypothetical protein